MNKFDRVVTILILLQTKKVVKAQDLATKFEVSLRTIYRDLKTLETAGIPIHAEAGIGYSLVEGYSLPPVMFTENEATSFLVAEKLINQFTDDKTALFFSDAVNKVKAVLKTAEKEKINNLENHILVSKREVGGVASNEKRMPQIFDSIDKREVLSLTYNALYNQRQTTRKIEPLGVHFYSSHWHLIAYCKLRQDYRDFRLDRIEKIMPLNETFERNHPNLKEYLDRMADEQDLFEVVIRFDKTAANFARTDKYFYGFVNEKEDGNHITMNFLIPSLHGMAHWLLVYVDRVTILEPKSLEEIMIELTNRLTQHYKR